MPPAPDEMLGILRENLGFDHPEAWLPYARKHAFKRVAATPVRTCPDCGGEARRTWGQYAYYSTLIRLRECGRCGLVWADAHIDPGVLRQHFEVVYKDEDYFRSARSAIFEQLAGIADRLAPRGGRVLDVGGARGHLMHRLAQRRPDLHLTVHDLSRAATDHAATQFGLATLNGDAEELAACPHRFDVVVLSDVIYYEPKLHAVWRALDRLVRPGGAVVIRIPNKSHWIRLAQAWFRLTHPGRRGALQNRVRFFNPEHIFLLRRPYLFRRLRRLGFRTMHALPSPPLGGVVPEAIRATFFRAATMANALSGRTLVLTPSQVVVATERAGISPTS